MTADPVYLFDTCAIIYVATGQSLKANATGTLDEAGKNGRVRVSAISALEIGMSMAKGRIASTLEPLVFFEGFVESANCEVYHLSPKTLISSSFLPNGFHRDPMDRILIATAREHDLTVVTRDRAILAYGAAGHVKTLEC